MHKVKFPSLWFKILVSAGLFALFLWHIDISHLYRALGKTKVSYLLIGLVLYSLAQVICAVKWQYLARALGIRKELKPMVGLYFIGTFFNLFLPTIVGGDITRGMYLNPSGRTRSSFLSVLAERVTGFLSLVLLASGVMLTSYGAQLPKLLRYGFPAATLTALLGIAVLPWVLDGTRTRMRAILREDLIIFWRRPHIALVALLYSAIFHTILVAIHICIAQALSIRVPIPYHFITLCLASLAGLLPSFNGIGPRDGAYLYLLSLIGIDKAYGLLFALLWFLIMCISSIIGCIVYLIRGLSPIPTTTIVDQH